MNYSVLMSVYEKESPLFLEESIKSILNQTLPTDDFVIVCDGRLPRTLQDVLENYSSKHKNINIVVYEENRGLGYALNFGLNYCKNEIVMRMDSDDIALPERAEIQVPRFINEGIDLSSSSIKLFTGNINNIVGERRLPLNEKEILKFSKTRNPFNHPSSIFKKSKVVGAGGYKTLLFREDYYLWIRMIQNGSRFNNIDDCLVFMRINDETFARRKNKTAHKSAKWLNKYMLHTHYINVLTFIKNGTIYFLRRFLPNSISKKLTKMRWKKVNITS